MSNNRFCWKTRPLALPQNIVTDKCCRFTVLTSRLIRCEYSASRKFEDRASQPVFYRDFPAVDYQVSETDGVLTIETAHLKLRYRSGKSFTENSLCIALKEEPASVWHYGEECENLGGTARTLDEANGEIPLEDGICSRYGYTVLDDSDTMLLNDEGWVEVRRKDTLDLYFFGYGYNYLDGVKDFYRLTGAPTMLPAYALGNWWSRYYKYSQQEYIDLMERFKTENLPFSVGILDMDWHITEVPDEYKDENPSFNTGWTGHTWNQELFPDYKAFLKRLNENHIKTALNLHPAEGVLGYEEHYKEMAQRCGTDPESAKRIPFDILSPKFMAAYFDELLHPLEDDGVNFWWMDWQQGTSYWWIHEENKDGVMQDEREVLDPLWMLNHLHILDIMRNGKRPMFFSRYSGPGAHRYSIGFSGDTIVTWDSLDFQPYFTATASNIGYCWWSHDIGGHMNGYRDEELSVRWLQLGVFSPINRLHSAGNDFMRKEPWCYSKEKAEIMGDWLRLRHRLFPYIYTMNYRAHHDLEPLVQPMYYQYPKCDAAYRVRNQFFFGSELFVAPITQKNAVVSKLGRATVFLPRGDWFDFFNGTHYSSKKGRVMDVFRSLADYPVFAKAGAIVPMERMKPHDNTLLAKENMEVCIFPGAGNVFCLYEDAGEYADFESGAFVTTEMNLQYEKTNAVFTIGKAEGRTEFIPAVRNWKLNFRGFAEDCRIRIFVNGAEISSACQYDPAKNTHVVEVTAKVTDEIKIAMFAENLMTANPLYREKCLDILQNADIAYWRKSKIRDLIYEPGITNKAIKRSLNPDCSPDEKDPFDAMKELLSLTEE